MLARGFFALADQEKGRFRTFLLASSRNFQRDETIHAHTQKRGGGRVVSLAALSAEAAYRAEGVDHLTPDRWFERRWALTFVEGVMRRLEEEFKLGARAELFVELRQRLWSGHRGEPVHALAARLGLNESAVHVMLHRLRHRLGGLIRAELAEQVNTPEELDVELAHLIRVLGNPE